MMALRGRSTARPGPTPGARFARPLPPDLARWGGSPRNRQRPRPVPDEGNALYKRAGAALD